jgi:hypothetical protein
LKEFRLQPVIKPRLKGSFTCPKVGTWDRLFNFPSEGRRAEDFHTEKIQRLRPGSNPRTRELEASTQTTRPPKPSKYGGKERRIQGFGGETLGKETNWKTQA